MRRPRDTSVSGFPTGRPLVMIAGMDPRIPSGHRSYVQAHALAAARAGFAPQIFYAGGGGEKVTATDFGVLHCVATPLHHPLVALVHRRAIALAVADYLERDGREGPYGVHSFGPWVGTGVLACKLLAARGIEAVAVASAYTTVAHEWRALVCGLRLRDGFASRSYLGWYPWMRLIGARVERDGYRSSRVVFVNYESVRRLVEATCGAGVEIRTLPYAAPAAFHAVQTGDAGRAPAEIAALEPAQAPLIVCVSRHDPRKGNDVLLRALAQLRDNGVEFRACLVGGGRLLSAHQRRVRELGLERSVCLAGRVPDVLGYLRDADIYVLPSLEEGSGSVSLLEALQLGKAVVASRCDGIPEDLRDGEDAVLVAPGEVRELADALASLLGDAPRREALGARAVDVYRRRFSANGFVGALSGAYNQVGVDP
jgi:glycosyltransferase involved in cell wall biosynthesis